MFGFLRCLETSLLVGDGDVQSGAKNGLILEWNWSNHITKHNAGWWIAVRSRLRLRLAKPNCLCWQISHFHILIWKCSFHLPALFAKPFSYSFICTHMHTYIHCIVLLMGERVSWQLKQNNCLWTIYKKPFGLKQPHFFQHNLFKRKENE